MIGQVSIADRWTMRALVLCTVILLNTELLGESIEEQWNMLHSEQPVRNGRISASPDMRLRAMTPEELTYLREHNLILVVISKDLVSQNTEFLLSARNASLRDTIKEIMNTTSIPNVSSEDGFPRISSFPTAGFIYFGRDIEVQTRLVEYNTDACLSHQKIGDIITNAGDYIQIISGMPD